MQTISKVYDSYDQAKRTIADLEHAGVAADEISLVANRYVNDAHQESDISATASGVGIGATIGGGVGLLAGVGMFAIPGLGPVIAAGWLAATAVGVVAGSAAGGIIGALIDAGTPESEAHVYSEAIRRGGTLVTVRSDMTADKIRSILDRHSPIDPILRRREYEQAGWKAFDASAPDYQPNEVEIERMRRRA